MRKFDLGIEIRGENTFRSICSSRADIVIVSTGKRIFQWRPDVDSLPLKTPMFETTTVLSSICFVQSNDDFESSLIVGAGYGGNIVYRKLKDHTISRVRFSRGCWFNSVCCVGSKFVAVSDMGHIVQWKPEKTDMKIIFKDKEDINSVCSIGSEFGHEAFAAVGSYGKIIIGSDARIETIQSGTKEGLFSVCSLGSNGFIVVGSKGIMIHIQKSRKTMIIDTGTNKFLASVCPFKKGVVAVGSDGIIVQWKPGCKAKIMNSKIKEDLRSVCPFKNGFVALGQQGGIISFFPPWKIQNHSFLNLGQRNKIKSIFLSFNSFCMFLAVMDFL